MAPRCEDQVPRLDPELYALRPWYHDFSSLGLDTTFLQIPLTPGERTQRALGWASGKWRRVRGPRTSPVPEEGIRSIHEVFRRIPTSHHLNQPVKDQHLTELIRLALPSLPPSPSCLELFCADGFFTCRIKKMAPGARVTALELDEGHVRRARTIARMLDLRDVVVLREDVGKFLEESSEKYHLVLCAGGLYHLGCPSRLLEQIGGVCDGYVVIQSVVTLETEDRRYFVAPAPGWEHGCRFSHAWLRDRIASLGWRIATETRAELPGNQRPQDRGSSFFLCRVR